MTPSRNHQILFLFLSPKNPLWARLKGKQLRVSEIAGIALVTPGSVSQWRHGTPVSANAIERVLQNFESAAKKTGARGKGLISDLNHYRNAFRKGDVPLTAMSAILGLTANEGRSIIDSLISERFPLLPAVYDSAGRNAPPYRANDTLNLYRGVYSFQMNRGKVGIIGTLDVRYVLSLEDGSAVRCKMHIPKLLDQRADVTPRFWEYDGFLSRREAALYWVFGKRADEQADFVYMITSTGKMQDGDLRLDGHYLTTGQDQARSRISQTVKLKRENIPLDRVDEFMMETPRTLI